MMDAASAKPRRSVWSRVRKPSSLPQRVPIRSAPDLERWLSDWVTARLRIALRDDAVDLSFAELGLDSVSVVRLSGDLEDLLHRSVDPAIAWEYPTIRDLAHYLAPPQDAATPTLEAPSWPE